MPEIYVIEPAFRVIFMYKYIYYEFHSKYFEELISKKISILMLCGFNNFLIN